MLKQGFQDDIQKIFNSITEHTKEKPQTLFFSATIPDWVDDLSHKYQNEDHYKIDLVEKSQIAKATSVTVNHYKVECRKHEMQDMVVELATIFTN